MKNAVFVLVVLLPVLTCQARIIYVDANGPPADFNNIQAAIDDSNDGDTVEVHPGRYTGPGNRDIDFKGKAITVRSTDPNDPNIIAGTIIDCNGTEAEPHRAFFSHSNEDANSILRGLTVYNGYGLEENLWEGPPISVGGAIYCKSSNPKIANCVIKDSSAGHGGGIFCNASSPLLVDCIVSGNSAFSGGGMYSYANSCPTLTNCIFTNNQVSDPGHGGGMVNDGSNPTLASCVFVSNRGGGAGGGMSNSSSSPVLTDCTFTGNSVPVLWLTGGGGGGMRNAGGSPKLTNCIFSGNSACGGGGMSNESSNPTLTNCTFVGNRGGGVGLAISNWWEDCCPRLTNCILWDGGNEIWNIYGSTPIITYSDVQGGWPGEGNIDEDPCFTDPGHWDPNDIPDDANDDFWVDGDYHLKSQAGRWDPNTSTWVVDSNTSPCIDRGDPMIPIGLEPFPNGGIINMGAYGGTAEASKSYFGKPPCEIIVAGDINGDCIVDFRDFSLMSLHWLENN